MKRTGEFVLGIIGIIIYGFFTLLGALMVWAQNNQDTIKNMLEEMAKDDPEDALSAEDLNDTLEAIAEGGGWVVFSAALITMVVGIVALVFLKGNKRPKPAGIMLIAVAVISYFVLGGIALFGAVLYIIAGIMALVRKPPVPMELD